VAAAVRRAGAAEYAFVAFSGHGWIAEDADTGRRLQKVVVGTGESLDFRSLRPKAKKVTMLCDVCREVIRLKRFTEHRKAAAAFSLGPEMYTRESYRSWYDAAIEDAAEGAFFLYGCSADEYCYEDPLAGGYFTGGLIDNASSWAGSAASDGCLPMQTALAMVTETVASMTAHLRPQQHPRGGPENRSRGNPFPFAVALV
jgi:hypothetical protein